MKDAQTLKGRDVVRVQLRILSLTATASDYALLGQPHLILGLVVTWLVGMGRSWDNPRASILQHTGIGSILYIFVLAAFLFCIIWPLRPHRWSYRHLLTFISLTAAPAAIYALPVEGFLSAEDARTVNAVFLGIVATWRVVMLWQYLRVHTDLPALVVPLALMLPLALIVAALSALNLDQAVFEFMGGFREPRVRTPNDIAYAVLMGLTFWSVILSPALVIAYVIAIVVRMRETNGNYIATATHEPIPGCSPDGTICMHIGETSTYCTKCWTNLYQSRQVHAESKTAPTVE